MSKIKQHLFDEAAKNATSVEQYFEMIMGDETPNPDYEGEK